MTIKAEELKTKELLDQLIEECQDRLSVWELEFVSDISDKITLGASLSPKQRAKVCEVWERHCL